MSLISTPNGDGTRTIQVDFPYFLLTPTGRPKKRQHYQRYNQEEAKAAAERHIARACAESARIEHNAERQHYLAIYVVKN